MSFLRLASFIFLFFFPSIGNADSLVFNLGFQMEAFVADSGEDVSRTSIGSFNIEYEIDFTPKLSIGVLGGGQTSLTTQETLSFGLGGFINYYFKGKPRMVKYSSTEVSLYGMEKWSYYAGFGVEERFLNSSEIDSEIRGGPFVRFGGRLLWNKKMFFTGNIKYLLAGAEYSSIEGYIGVGIPL